MVMCSSVKAIVEYLLHRIQVRILEYVLYTIDVYHECDNNNGTYPILYAVSRLANGAPGDRHTTGFGLFSWMDFWDRPVSSSYTYEDSSSQALT